MYNLHLSVEQLEIRDTVRDFVAQTIRPAALRPERLEAASRLPAWDLLEPASRMGLRALALSEQRGGAGADTLTCCLVAEELAAGDVDCAAMLNETSTLARLLFDRLMSDAQRDRLLPQFLADDRYHLAFAGREPDAGAELGVNYHRPAAREAAMPITAFRAANGEWVVNGASSRVANAPVAKLVAVRVAAAERACALLVPCDTPGLSVHRDADAHGWHHGTCGDVIFNDCRVPTDNLIALEHLGAAGADRACAKSIGTQRAAMNLGVGRAAYEAALDYAQLRVQGGRRIIEHQAIGAKLAEIAIRLEVARAAVWQAAWAADHPEAVADRSLPDLPLAAIARVFTAEAVYRVAKDAAEVFGAMGVMRDMPLQKYVRDALIFLHSGGGVSDAKLAIAETLAGYRRPSAPTVRAAE
jgi:alkylation response protein AidB-like acyl-CoA dehydrogenase